MSVNSALMIVMKMQSALISLVVSVVSVVLVLWDLEPTAVSLDMNFKSLPRVLIPCSISL